MRLGAYGRAGELVTLALVALLVSCGGSGGSEEDPEPGGNGIAMGEKHACVLRNGGVWCWGANDVGQLGDGTTADRTTAAPVLGLSSGVRAIAVGAFHGCAVVRDGVMCWGSNGSLELGSEDLLDRYRATPVRVTGLSRGVQAIAAGANHTCVVVDGGVSCWGNNSKGQLGTEDGVNSWTPQPIPGLEGRVVAIAAGGRHSCVVIEGGVRCWGETFNGQLGDGSAGNASFFRSLPYQTIPAESGATAVAASRASACALVSGALQCWGSAAGRQFGAECGAQCARPVTALQAPEGLTSFRLGFANVYLLANGAVSAVGDDTFGQLGDGDPKSGSESFVGVTGLTVGAEAIASQGASACALLGEGGVQCWGENDRGQLGDGSIETRTAPVTVQGL